jgi:hypothetical protein
MARALHLQLYRVVTMASSPLEPDLFTALRLFRPWPHPVVQCPQCEDVAIRPVAVRIVHGSRETVIDACGVHGLVAAPSSAVDSRTFELELTLQCTAHESTLRIAPEQGGALRAVVEVRSNERAHDPIGRGHPKLRRPVLRLVRSETQR